MFRQEQQHATMFRNGNGKAVCAERGAVNQLARRMSKPRPSVCSVRYSGTRGIFGGRTELTEVSGTGIIQGFSRVRSNLTGTRENFEVC